MTHPYYMLLTSNTAETLAIQVNEKHQLGYKLHMAPGLSMTDAHQGICKYFQAMTLEKFEPFVPVDLPH
jgi:hypothetical protein